MEKPIKQFKKDLLRVYVYETRAEMGRAAYNEYKKSINEKLQKREQIRAIFAAAQSQSDFLKAMANDKETDFSLFDVFHMDEYIGLSKDEPQKFGNFLKRNIFSKQPFHEVNYLNSDVSDVLAECKRYETLLKAAPLDIVSLGIGENGHLAFNDPCEAKFDAKEWVRTTTLEEISRQQQVNDGEFSNIDMVPKIAITLTIPALMSCNSIIGIIPNERKAKAVYDALYGPVTQSCPASILRTHPNASIFLDKDSAKLIINQ